MSRWARSRARLRSISAISASRALSISSISRSFSAFSIARLRWMRSCSSASSFCTCTISRRLASAVNGDVALGAQLLERLLVLEFALLDGEALIEHEGLLLAQLLGLLVGDLLVLAGARDCFLALDLQQFELGGEILAGGSRPVVCFSVVWTLRRASEVISVMTLRPSASNTLSERKYSLVDCSSATMVTSSSIRAVGDEAFADTVLDLAGEAIAVLMQLFERLGGGEAAQARRPPSLRAGCGPLSASNVFSPSVRLAVRTAASVWPTCAYNSAFTSMRMLSDGQVSPVRAPG